MNLGLKNDDAIRRTKDTMFGEQIAGAWNQNRTSNAEEYFLANGMPKFVVKIVSGLKKGYAPFKF